MQPCRLQTDHETSDGDSDQQQVSGGKRSRMAMEAKFAEAAAAADAAAIESNPEYCDSDQDPDCNPPVPPARGRQRKATRPRRLQLGLGGLIGQMLQQQQQAAGVKIVAEASVERSRAESFDGGISGGEQAGSQLRAIVSLRNILAQEQVMDGSLRHAQGDAVPDAECAAIIATDGTAAQASQQQEEQVPKTKLRKLKAKLRKVELKSASNDGERKRLERDNASKDLEIRKLERENALLQEALRSVRNQLTGPQRGVMTQASQEVEMSSGAFDAAEVMLGLCGIREVTCNIGAASCVHRQQPQPRSLGQPRSG